MSSNAATRVVALATLVLFLLTTGLALAGAGGGGGGGGKAKSLKLGKNNKSNKETKLRGSSNLSLLRAENTGAGAGLVGRHRSDTGTRAGVEGTSGSTEAEAAAVLGRLTALPGPGSAAVRGEVADTTATNGIGVLGRHDGNGYGVYAEALGTGSSGLFARGGNYGGLMYATQPGSTALYASGQTRGIDAYAEASSGNTYGVFADTDSSGGGIGVYGRADAASGANAGVVGEAYSDGGYGGRFRNFDSGSSGAGVRGTASGATGTDISNAFFAGGVEGIGANGVVGLADRDNGYGILGVAGDGDYAGFFSGNVNVSGTLSKSAGSFLIDHPLDPENKTLAHSFVESPDMKNVYDGQVELDPDGEALVRLPRYFEALNRDPRYQLTAIGAAAPELHIASEVKDNEFEIAGGVPGMTVSWQVTGIRRDAYARQNRIRVVERKPASERGTYLNPEAFGEPRRAATLLQTAGGESTEPPWMARGDEEPELVPAP